MLQESMAKRRSRPASLEPAALGALVALGATLRLWGLGSSALNFDESFTAMVGRLPLGSVFDFLRVADSHPPLDYLLQLPLARVAAPAFVFRLPSALCSIAALALFAWWMRGHGRVGVLATAAMSICAFQVAYAREARMYGPMQLIGVGSAVLAHSWLRAPRRGHAWIVGALTFAGLMTHVSMVLAAAGLLAVAGRRRDADAWRWRAAIAAGALAWMILWGPSFLTQSRGGHSSWIPHTTVARFVDTVGALVTTNARYSLVVFAAIVAGAIVCRRRDRELATVLVCCFAVPVLLAGLLGLRAPVLLDRTLTVASWGPLLALGFLADAIAGHARIAGVAVAAGCAVLLAAGLPAALQPTGPTAALAELERVARPGDMLVIQPPTKGIELDWAFAVRGDDGPAAAVQLPGLQKGVALALTGRRATGRIWVMQLTHQAVGLQDYRSCAPAWRHGPNRMLCLRQRHFTGFPRTSPPAITTVYREFARPPRARIR